MSEELAPQESDFRGDAKLQALGRQLLSGLYMLVRSVKLYDPENAIFVRPLDALLETCNNIVAKDGKLDMAVVSGSFYVNSHLIRVDQATLENLKHLASEMESHQIGGFNLHRPTTINELRDFIWVFAKDQSQQAGEDGVDGHKLPAMRLTRWAKLKEKLDKASENEGGKVDRKKYALTLYARGIFFMDDYLARLREGKPPPPGRAARLLQDLIEVTFEQRNQFLGMTSNGDGEQNLTYHLVNTALLAIGFGGELGLSKPHLKELGLAALLNEAPLCRLPTEHRLALQPQKLPPQIQARRAQAFHEAAQQALAEPNPGKLQFLRAVSAIQMHQPYGDAMRDAAGRITMVMPKSDPLFFSRILAICSYYDVLTSNAADHEAYGPEIALELMWNQERWRFDPELLRAFIGVMGRQPIKMLSKGRQQIDIAGV